MSHGWDDDGHFDVHNPDLGLLMSDCPVELSIQSHSLMLNVRRSVKLSTLRESTASPWATPAPREVAVLRRVKSFQQPAVSTSIGPTLTRIRSFFDFSREDSLAFDSEASNINFLDQDGDRVEGDDNREVGVNEEPTSSDVKAKVLDDAEAYLNCDVEKAVDADEGEFQKPVKADVTQTIKKIESVLEEALSVGPLKIDVRDRLKRIQTAFEGFLPWDSGTGKPKVELNAVNAAESVKPPIAGVMKILPSQNDSEQGSDIMNTEGGLNDSSGSGYEARNLETDNGLYVGHEQEPRIEKGGIDNLIESYFIQGNTPRNAATVNSTPGLEERVVEDMEEAGLCKLNSVKDFALGSEVVNQLLSGSDPSHKEERLSVEMDDTELSGVDEVDDVQADLLDFEARSPVAVGDGVSDPELVRMNSYAFEEGQVECDLTTTSSSCKAAVSKSVGIQCDVINELTECDVIYKDTSQCCNRFDMPAESPALNVVNDASVELNQMNEKGVQDIAEVDKVQVNEKGRDTTSWKLENLQSGSTINLVHENALVFHDETERLDVREQVLISNAMSDRGRKELDDARLNVLRDSVSVTPLDTQIAVSSELMQERAAKEINDKGSRKPNFRVDTVRPVASGESVLSEKDATDLSSLPSPLSQLLNYRSGSAFTFLNVQDHFPDVGECLMHEEEKVFHIQPSYLSPDSNLETLLAPGESWGSQEEPMFQSSGRKVEENTGRLKVVVNLRRLRIRKSVRPNAVKASPSNLSSERDTPSLHSGDLSQTVKNLCQDDLHFKSHLKKKPAKEDFPPESSSPIHSVVDQAPSNHRRTKSRLMDEPSLENPGKHGGSPLHVKRIATPASVRRVDVESHKNLSEKYRPVRFEDLAGQASAVNALTTCILRQKIAPVYLFLGPRGTGKMSTARIFAAGLNCISLELKSRPCGSCRECSAVILDMSPNVQILDAPTVRDLSSTETLMKRIVSQLEHKVIIIKECDSFSTDIWTALLKIMEDPPSNVVLVLISTTANRIPLAAISRCKKVHFYNVSDDEIVNRLQALAQQEALEVDMGALALIASRSNGSIHYAETMLEQLILADKKVSLAAVQKHCQVGLLPDRKLLNLLDFALSADTANTTKTMNEILGSSVEPLLLVSQLGLLITNILVENFDAHRETRKIGYFRPSFSGKQMQRRLRQALKILSEAEKHVRVSTDSLTWLTAALLQCASDRPFPTSVVGSLAHAPMTPKSREHCLEMLVSADIGTAENELRPAHVAEQSHEGRSNQIPKSSEPKLSIVEPSVERFPFMHDCEGEEARVREPKESEEHEQAPVRLNAQATPVAGSMHVLEEQDSIELWNRVLQELTSRNLKHLLLTQGRLVSAGVASDGSRAIVEVEFQYAIDKHKAERSWRSICSAFQAVLNIPIELRISLMKNIFDEGSLPRNLEGMDDEERTFLTQHMSRLKQEAEVVSYSTDSHCGSHTKRRRRRARRDWQPNEVIEPEREPRHQRSNSGSVLEARHRRSNSGSVLEPRHHRSDSGSVLVPTEQNPKYMVREPTSARPTGEWQSNGMESSYSESVAQHSGSLESVQSRLLVGSTARRPRLRTMLSTPLSESADGPDAHAHAVSPEQFRTDRGLPLEAFCFPCNQRVTQFRRELPRDIDEFDRRREGDSGPIQMRGRGRAQGQAFFLRLLPCKSISAVRFSKVSFSDIKCTK